MTTSSSSDPAARTKALLMVAFHFPPMAISSGIQRTLRLVQQLPAYGWHPLVLSANERAYECTRPDLEGEIPPATVVERAFALDTARQLAFRGRYIASLARPDRWRTWKFDAVRRGMAMIRRHQPAAIWTTYPIATAHAIGAELQRRSGLPWIADFRDPMAQDGYPKDPLTWAQYKAIEELVARQACLLTFTTRSATRVYRERYPFAEERMALMENGYDESTFAAAERSTSIDRPLNPGRLTLLHSGVVYPWERDPTHLFSALAQLKALGLGDKLVLRLRATMHDDLLARMAAEHGVAGMVELCSAVPYAEALAEMLRADGLLVLQAGNCNAQVPAKLYEYLRAGRPVLCLSDDRGDTWDVLRRAGLTRMAALDNADDIALLLKRFVAGNTQGLLPSTDSVTAASRDARTAQLVRWLDACASKERLITGSSSTGTACDSTPAIASRLHG